MKKINVIFIVSVALAIILSFSIYFVIKNKTNISKAPENKNNIVVIHGDDNKPPKDTEKRPDEKIRNKLYRPIAFMIDNLPEVMPQAGVSDADYVYELMAEGGITRLMAVYTKDGVDKIGPVRSARHDFVDLSMEYDAIYGHWGGSNLGFLEISNYKVPNLNGLALDGTMYWRESSRKAPHNGYTSIERTLKYAKNYGYDKKNIDDNHFKFNLIEQDLKGNTTVTVNIPYSYYQGSYYEYDIPSKLYKRFVEEKGNKKPQIDENNNEQLAAKNIIIQFARYYSIDSEDRQDITLVGTGKGYYISSGKYINITWKKSSARDKTIFFDENGDEIRLNAGQTWIHVVPVNSQVTIK